MEKTESTQTSETIEITENTPFLQLKKDYSNNLQDITKFCNILAKIFLIGFLIMLALPLSGVLGSIILKYDICTNYASCFSLGILYGFLFFVNNGVIFVLIWFPICYIINMFFVPNNLMNKILLIIFFITYFPLVLYFIPLVGSLVSLITNDFTKCSLENYNKFMFCTFYGYMIFSPLVLIMMFAVGYRKN